MQAHDYNVWCSIENVHKEIIDVEACTDLIGLELHQMGYTNLHAPDISQKMLNEARKKGIYTPSAFQSTISGFWR